MKIYFSWTILGCLFIFIGIDIWKNNGGKLHYSYVSSGGGVILIIFGIFMVYHSRAKKKQFPGKYYKCLNCGNIHPSNEISELKCPECKGEIENLKGFFRRNPDKR